MTETITTSEAQDGGAAQPGPSRSWSAAAARAAWIAAWVVVAVLAWIAVSRLFGITFPARVTVMLQALTPIVFLPAYVIAGVAFVRRRWALGAVCVALAVIHVASVYPALGHRSLPAWAAGAPRVTILEANV